MNRKTASAMVTGLVALVVAASPVLAANPHFIYATGYESSGSFFADFKIAGLGKRETTTVTLSGYVTADWHCINRGNKEPSGLIRTNEEVTISGDFTSDRNGSIEDTIDADPTPPLCPPGMKESVLDAATWTDVTIDALGESLPVSD